jgi:hypothetical protein
MRACKNCYRRVEDADWRILGSYKDNEQVVRIEMCETCAMSVIPSIFRQGWNAGYKCRVEEEKEENSS